MAARHLLGTIAVAFLALACSSEPEDQGGGAGGSGGAGGDAPVYADPYGIQAFDGDRIVSDPAAASFQDIFAAIDLRDPPFASVRLVVDLASTCYPFEGWQDNPPPAGENWPADCDAFDRNFEWSLDHPKDDPAAPPGLELARAITPFGGPLHLEIDITDVANALPGEHQLRAHISTWSDAAGQVSGSNGGWTVSARIEVTPGAPPRSVLAVVPLHFGSQSDDAGPAPIAFTAPPETVAGKIEYRVTGHGGGTIDGDCIGPADEFCRREHTVSIDGVALLPFEPWRSDCEELCTITHYGPPSGGFDYCLENPCGALQSVQAPRANWCPGSLTPPFVFEEAALGATGDHTFDWTIANVGEGGSWTVSATYFAYGP